MWLACGVFVVQARKEGAQKKGTEVLRELQASIDANTKKMEAQIQKVASLGAINEHDKGHAIHILHARADSAISESAFILSGTLVTLAGRQAGPNATYMPCPHRQMHQAAVFVSIGAQAAVECRGWFQQRRKPLTDPEMLLCPNLSVYQI